MVQLVDEKHACPHCGEQEMDKLEIDEEDEYLVFCCTCGHYYRLRSE
jgi:transcription elongation factor Elf1